MISFFSGYTVISFPKTKHHSCVTSEMRKGQGTKMECEEENETPQVIHRIFTLLFSHILFTFYLKSSHHGKEIVLFTEMSPSPTASLQRKWGKGLSPNSIVSENAISTHKLKHSSMVVRSSRLPSIM